jgi:RNA polymerase sigma-70 factor (ECF subfamily)
VTVSDRTDSDLVTRIAKGDAVALEALFARHHTRIFRFVARQTGDDSLAEEVATDVFLEIWQHAGRFKGGSRVGTYLLAIARNKAISKVRRKRAEIASDDVLETISDPADTPEVHSQKKSKSEALREAINQLPEEFRTVIDLIYYQELSIAEIAEVLAIPAQTVKTRAFRGRKRLSGLLENFGVDRGWP